MVDRQVTVYLPPVHQQRMRCANAQLGAVLKRFPLRGLKEFIIGEKSVLVVARAAMAGGRRKSNHEK